ncbi:DUF962 domain-containing protein [Undibacterium sp. Jales W-56]|uniref:Mpo1 family 2-hydroxy fatty acid dioxygenase n=1 Tax=Undibacterium sp. Jales W-56 TaxID=2897325 RepID=UPI0021D10D7C|nr:Mpo1-like protein [Undibacterium sp. Jales W-56]MCU6432814.1 DUF962 domain-containing protein [Undibacterium sp. Jales W-56]
MSKSTNHTGAEQRAASRTVDQLLEKYAESHRNPTNEYIHFVCVPAIMWTVLGLIWALHPVLAIGAALLALIYYVSLSVPLAIGMSLMAALMLGLLYVLPATWVLPLSIGVFVVAWIFQFIGHKIEGKKPSFFDDLRFLLIGPLFVLGFLYRRLKISY